MPRTFCICIFLTDNARSVARCVVEERNKCHLPVNYTCSFTCSVRRLCTVVFGASLQSALGSFCIIYRRGAVKQVDIHPKRNLVGNFRLPFPVAVAGPRGENRNSVILPSIRIGVGFCALLVQHSIHTIVL